VRWICAEREANDLAGQFQIPAGHSGRGGGSPEALVFPTSTAGSARMYARALLLLMKLRSSSLGGPRVLTISLSWST
jgi:hypothetical protein